MELTLCMLLLVSSFFEELRLFTSIAKLKHHTPSHYNLTKKCNLKRNRALMTITFFMKVLGM